LSHEEAAQGLGVAFEATVTYYSDAQHRTALLHWMSAKQARSQLTPTVSMEVTGADALIVG
jgi:hypothetical protein